MHTEICIIGGGPAGVGAAIQLKRFDMEPLLFEKNQPGGLLRHAHRVENYPGFIGGIPGSYLANQFKFHLESFSINVINNEITAADFDQIFSLVTTNESYSSDILVVASGTKPKTEGIIEHFPIELKKYAVFDILSLPDREGTHIIIVGAGDIAFDYALRLSEFKNNEITILHRGEEIKALPLLIRRVKDKPNIHIVGSSSLRKITRGEHKALAVTFSGNSNPVTIEADYLLGAIGRIPQKDFFSPRLLEMEKELMNNGRLYLVGDIVNGVFRQAAIASGQGIEAAMKIYHRRSRRVK